MAEQSKTFCVLPFIHSHASVSGNWKSCCNAFHMDLGKNLYSDNGHTHKTWFESPRMDLLRKNLLTGVRDDMCSVCWKAEDVSGTSIRMRYNNGDKFADAIKKIDVDKPKIQYLDLKISNECNLKCRMCDYTNSHKLLEDVVAIENDEELDLPIEWHRSPKHEIVINDIGIKSMPDRIVDEITEELLPNLRVLKVTGGEPLVQKQVLDLFKVCVEKDYAKNIDLHITTNGTKFTKKFMEGIKTFRKASFNISCDGYGKVYDYIRYPFNWTKFSQRVTEAVEVSSQSNNLGHITICPVAQMYNIENLHELQKWSIKLSENHGHRVEFFSNTFLQPLSSYNSLRNVPCDILEEARERLVENQNTTTLLGYIDNLVKDKKSGKIVIDEKIEKLIYKSVRAKDKVRNQRFSDFVGPRTSKWLEGIFKKYA